jgi:uncharacterized membrane protein YeaQ/YmgE (transglycosylase-associated protein family)
MEIIGFLIIGLIVGALARLLMPGRDPIGIFGTLALGVLGAIIGGYIAGAVFEDTQGVDWIASIASAALLLFLYRRMSYGRTTGTRF